MLWRALAFVFNRIPVRWQRRILDRANPRFLVGVAGVGVDATGRLLLARHRFGSPPWRLLGGFIHRRESFPEALRRELEEETGLAIEVGPILEANTGSRWARVEVVYAYRVVGSAPVSESEVDEVRAFAADDLPPMRIDQRGLIERHGADVAAWARTRTDPATIGVPPRKEGRP
ncbi:MAG: NUDIX domain-containing protein [Chloroflexota bacterium]|nr:NUDIX domain-containing protein [Chloroflexota bacterium]MDE3192776.1 NUDIX domain-containing protein [Chloroflexota bacterium]